MSKISKAYKIWKEGDSGELIDRTWHQVSKDVLPPVHSAKRRVYQRIRSKPSTSKGKTLYPIEDSEPNWISHDENWKKVVHRFKHREALQKGRSISVSDEPQDLSGQVSWESQDSLSVNVPATKSDRWVWLSLNPDEHLWQNFRWEFDIARESAFRELQFGFRYNGFYNRHRFQHEYGKLRYEKVKNGVFYKHFQTEPFEMEIGKKYHFTIEAVGNWFTLNVDGETIIEEFDFEGDFPYGSCAIILWDKGDDTPIQANISNMEVTELII